MMTYDIDQLKFSLKFPLILSPLKDQKFFIKEGKREEHTMSG